jgi:hypothetical protein
MQSLINRTPPQVRKTSLRWGSWDGSKEDDERDRYDDDNPDDAPYDSENQQIPSSLRIPVLVHGPRDDPPDESKEERHKIPGSAHGLYGSRGTSIARWTRRLDWRATVWTENGGVRNLLSTVLAEHQKNPVFVVSDLCFGDPLMRVRISPGCKNTCQAWTGSSLPVSHLDRAVPCRPVGLVVSTLLFRSYLFEELFELLLL